VADIVDTYKMLSKYSVCKIICFVFQQGNQHISKSVENEEKRNSGEVQKPTKPHTTVISTAQNTKPPSENGISRAGNQAKPSNQTTTKSVSVTKVERTQPNGTFPLEGEKDSKTSKVTVSFPPTMPASMNGQPDKKAVTNGGGKSTVVKNNQSSIASEPPSLSFKSSVSVKPSSSQPNQKNSSKESKESNISNSSKSVEPVVTKADPKLVKSNAPSVVYHMGRPVAVDQNLSMNRDQMLADIRNFKRKSDPVKPVEKEVKQIFSSTPSDVLGSSNSKDLPLSSEEDVDSGSGSVEGSPKVEKFVSSFSFPQNTRNTPGSGDRAAEQKVDKGKTTPPALTEAVKVKGNVLM
jgi:hypothetical protein